MLKPCEGLMEVPATPTIDERRVVISSHTTVPMLLAQGLEPGSAALGQAIMTAARLHNERKPLCLSCPLKEHVEPEQARTMHDASEAVAASFRSNSQVFVDVLGHKVMAVAEEHGLGDLQGPRLAAFADCAQRRALVKSARPIEQVPVGNYL